MRTFPDSFALHPAATATADRLIQESDDFEHLTRARFAVVGSARTIMHHGAPAAAVVGSPRTQGAWGGLMGFCLETLASPRLDWEPADFYVMVDAAVWDALDPLRQERLMYHELSHVVPRETEFGEPQFDSEGRPRLKFVPHDCEVFDAELRRYGPEVVGIESTLDAIVDGAADAKRRNLRVA